MSPIIMHTLKQAYRDNLYPNVFWLGFFKAARGGLCTFSTDFNKSSDTS